MTGVGESAVFTKSLREWGGDGFVRTLKQEIESLPPGTLPLHDGVTQGGRVDDAALTATVLRAGDSGDLLLADVGIFFTEVVAGCSCGDEPMALNAYCELQVSIDRRTARAAFRLLVR